MKRNLRSWLINVSDEALYRKYLVTREMKKKEYISVLRELVLLVSASNGFVVYFSAFEERKECG